MTAIIVRRSPSRALTAVEPYYRPMSFLDEFDRFAREAWEGWTPVTYPTSLTPRMCMYEEKDDLVMQAELPGIKKEDIDISLEGECLTIKAEKKQEEWAKDATCYSCERCFGLYSRSVSLPFHVDADGISATYDNGLLEIRLPKSEEAKTKHIEVKVR